ncbi:MAG TPA: tetratricopeptide repeat protein [Gemmatimonadaceae bacterium]|nr:tetratricopeptide repeat protein [Gemmatimonadaceae bacterium]
MRVTCQPRLILGLIAVTLGAVAPVRVLAQTRTTTVLPDETPRALVVAFRSPEKGAGPQLGENIRTKLQADIPIKQMYVIPKATICANLEASGFPCDSMPDAITSRLLATSLRADFYVDGVVTKSGTGYKAEARLVLARDNSMVQPLPTASGAKLGDLASILSKAILDARKELPEERSCETKLAAGDAAGAIVAAKAAIATYPQSSIGRVCLANALLKQNASPDSVIAVATQVTAIDPRSRPALIMLGDAYAKKNDLNHAVEAWTKLIAAYPKDVALVSTVVNKIGQSGQAAAAKPIIVAAVDSNPGDPDLVHLKWLILLATKECGEATAAGEQMIKTDTASADTTFFLRQSACYAQANDPQKAAATAAQGVAKFKNNAALWSLYAQTLRLAGQLPQSLAAAQTAVKLDPKTEHGYLRIAQAQIDLNQPDSAIATLKQAVASGEDKATVGQFLLVLGNKAYKDVTAAVITTPDSLKIRREGFQRAELILAASDSASPSPAAKFVLGVSAFKVGDSAVRDNQKEKQCELAKLAESSFLTAQINIAAGGSIDPKTAQQLLSALEQYRPAVQGQVKKFCK